MEKTLKTEVLNNLVKKFTALGVLGVCSFIIYLGYMGKTEFSSRVMTLMDPQYASKYIPIIASVSEHQPNRWTNIFFDFHFHIFLQPIGLYYLLKKPTPEKLFLAIYFVTSIYF